MLCYVLDPDVIFLLGKPIYVQMHDKVVCYRLQELGCTFHRKCLYACIKSMLPPSTTLSPVTLFLSLTALPQT